MCLRVSKKDFFVLKKKKKNWQPNTRYRIKVKIRYRAKNKMKICPYCIETVGLIFFLGFNMFFIGYIRSLTRKKKKQRDLVWG